MPDEIWLRLIGLRKQYGGRTVLEGLNLEVRRGELFTFLGPSGAGKTTILHCIAGLVHPEQGQVHLGAREISRLPAGERNIGMVFQNLSLFSGLTVEENITFPLEARDHGGVLDLVWKRVFRPPRNAAIQDKLSWALDLVQLATHAGKLPHQLSGGEQQRVALARALIFEPALLCLDEPLSSLDKNLRQHMQTEIRSLQQRLGITTLYVTHDQAEAFLMSDRIALIRAGRIEQLGTPKELYDHPLNDFVATFLGECNCFHVAKSDRTADRCLLTTRRGTQIASTPAASNGSDIIGLRPERIRVCAQQPSQVPPVSAKVIGRTFLGAHIRLALQTAESTPVIATLPAAECPEPPIIGATVFLDYPPEAVMVLKTSQPTPEQPLGPADCTPAALERCLSSLDRM